MTVSVLVALFAAIFLLRAEANPASRAGAVLMQANSSVLTLQAPTVEIVALPESITVGGQSVLMITLTNPNMGPFDDITGAQLTLNYPAPLHIENAQGGAVVNDTCSPSVLAVAGQATASMTGGTIPAGGSCTFGIEVVGTSQGSSAIHTGSVTSANASPSVDATVTLTVIAGSLLAGPGVAMEFSPTNITVGGTSQMTLTFTNNDADNAVTGLQIADLYPFGIANASNGALVRNTCGGLLNLRPDNTDYELLLLDGTIPAGGTCNVVVNVVGTSQSFPDNFTDSLITGNAQGGNFASAQMVVTSGLLLGAPTATMQFVPTTVDVGEISQMTITLFNTNSNAITGAQFSDNYPGGMANAPDNVVASNTCGGVATADRNGSSIALANGNIPVGGNCVIVVNVIGTAIGQWVNQTGPLPSGNALTGGSAIAGFSVQASAPLIAPTVSKAFNPSNVAVGDSSQMTIALTNNDPSRAITGVQFTDPYPGGMLNASSGVIVSNGCGGTVTAPQNGLSVALTNGTIPAGGVCSVVIKVIGTTPGGVANHTGAVNSVNANPGADAMALLTIGAAPDLTLTKTHVGNFSLGQTSATYSLIVHNIGAASTSGSITVIDALPPSLTATAMSGQGWMCSVANKTCTRNDVLQANSSFQEITLTVHVAASAPSSVTNIATVSGGGEVNSANDSASDPTSIALAAPFVGKAFEPSNVTVAGTSQMSILLINPDAFTPMTGVQFVDNYPGSMLNASSNPIVSNSCGGTVTAAANGTSTTLTGGTVQPNQECVIRINVVDTLPGNATNHTGSVTSDNANPTADASATLAVSPGSLLPAPTMVMGFAPSNIIVGGVSQMTLTLSNTNATAIFGAQFTDHYPQGMTEAGYGVLSNTCGGSLDEYPDSIALINGSIPAQGSCSIIVQMTASLGTFVNQASTVPSGNAITANGASATLTVGPGTLLVAPTVTKAFMPTTVGVGDVSQMTIMLTNNDPNVAISGAQIFDSYPAPLHMANASGNVVVSNSCGGNLTAIPGAALMILGNGTIPASSSCSVVIKVVGTSAGTVDNHTASVLSGNANGGTDAHAGLVVTGSATAADLTLSKSHAGNFSQAQTGAVYSLIAHNIGGTATSGTVTVTDTLPNSLTATDMSGPGWTCTPATLSCTRSDPLAAGTSYPAITLTVDVAASAPSTVTNTASVSGGGETDVSNDSASDPTIIDGASLGPDMSLTKIHAGNFSQGQTGAVYSLIAHNVGGAATSGTVTVADTLPPSMTPTAMSGPGWTCSPATVSCTRSDPLAAGSSYSAITLKVDVAANAPASAVNVASASGGGETNVNNDPANDPTSIDGASAGPDLTLTKSHSGDFSQGQTGAVYTLTAHNVGGAATSGVVTVTDTLPPSLTATQMIGNGWTCPPGTTSCTRSDPIPSGASYPDITLTVDVAASAPPLVTNVASVSGGAETNINNDPANDSTSIAGVVVGPDLTLTKSHVGDFTEGQVGATYTLTVHNVGGSATNGAVTVTDTLPPSMIATQLSGNGWSCSIGTITCTRSNPLASGVSYADITLKVNVAPNAPATATNTATVSGGGETNTSNDGASDLTTIQSNGGNHAPVAVGDAAQVTLNGTTGDIVGDAKVVDSLLDNDVDADASVGDTLKAIKVSDPIHGTLLQFNADGTFVYWNTSSASSDVFTYKACDSHNTCSAETKVTVTIGNALNNHVPFATDDAIEVVPGSSAVDLVGDPNNTDSVLDNDIDFDGDTLTATKLTDPGHGNLVQFNADGTFKYQNTSSASTDSFLYQACDVFGACDLGVVSITIGNGLMDSPPVVVDDAIQVTPNPPGNTSNTLIGDLNIPSSVLDNDSDPDLADVLTATKMSGLLNASGTLTFNADGTFTYQNTDPSVSTDSFFYEACDESMACMPGIVSITVTNNPPDSPPIAMNDAILVGANGTANTLVGDPNVPNSVLDNDSDPDSGDTLKAHLIQAPVNGDVTLNADGTFVYVNKNPLADSWQYEACDASGACVAATVSVTINQQAPTVSCVLPKQVDVVGDAVSIDLSLLFTPPAGQTLTYSATNPPPALSIIGSLLAGTLTTSGTYTSSLNATTVPGGASASENVIFEVLPAGDRLLRDGFDTGTTSSPCQ